MAKWGTWPIAPKDQRTASGYIFGAICPRNGKGAALVMPRCDTEAMNFHLAEIATQIVPGAHAAVLVDQAGWHLSGRLNVPPNITLVPLPLKCPELNPQENVWQFMRDNWLSNRIFKSYDDIVDHCWDVYPYRGEPQTTVERAERQMFDIVAVHVQEIAPDPGEGST